MQRDQWAEAARSMEKVAELDPGSERAIQRLAICYLRMQKKEKMIEQFAKLSKLRPADFAMHYDLGRLYENEGMTEEAIREYEAARELFDPEKPHTETAMALMLERLAQLYQAEKQIEEAEKCYRQIMDVQPAVDRAALFMSIGRLNYLGERWQKAADAFEEAAKQKPDLPEARKYLAFCYDEMKDYERAIIEAKKCLQMGSQPRFQWEMRRALSFFYAKTKQSDQATKMRREAVSILEKNVAASSGNPEEYLALGELYRREKRMDDALRIAQKALRLPVPGDVLARQVHLLMAETYYDMDDDEKTEQALRRALEFAPDYPMTNNFLGYFYAERGVHLDEAVRLIEKALKAEPGNGAYLDSLGWAWFQQGTKEGNESKVREALNKLLEAVEKMPDPVIREHIGDVYHSMGELDKAEQEWQRSLALWEEQPHMPPGPEGVRKKLGDLLKLKMPASAGAENGR